MGSHESPDVATNVVDHEALRARLAAIVDSSDDAIVSKTLDGVITSWNLAAERLFGYAAAEAIGQPIFLIIPEDRRTEEENVLARLRQGEKLEHFETVRKAKDGRLIPISLTVSPIRDAKGTIVGASKVARDITERVLAREAQSRAHDELERRVRERTAELSAANEQRAQLFNRLVLAQEEERRRIARELHDQLGQQMTALRLTLETLRPLALERSELRTHIESLQELSKQIDQDIAFRVWELRPAMLDGVDLEAVLRQYATSWSKRFGIHTELHLTRPAADLAPELETTIYRFAQEALNNVAKHARASRVDIVMEQTHAHLSFIVEDDGIGFDPSRTQNPGEGLGLVGMRERAALAGAHLHIESAPGKGTTVLLRIPTPAGTTTRST
jgi:two-component system sensor histidine kinase UhpB